ncbi:BspA family leucine-rich repeat surface protein [Flavobacteriaceae bacterium]|nr:BspA family leucine-rich repeat surface protein [Flavobacteriaceae bacterium]
MKKLLYLFLTVLIVGCSDDDGNPCLYNPTLTTSAVTNITETSATLNGVISIVSENCDDPNNTEQGFVYATTIQPTTANNKINVNGTDVTTTLENLEPNTTYYVRTFLTNAFGEFYGNEVSFMTSEEPCDVVYLADNGITIKAYECAEVGDTGVINGVTYTVVDEAMLRTMVANEEDVTKVVTTKVTNMSELFFIDFDTFSDFNQDISNWDVSNVADMSEMFLNASSFNQPIGDWDVSNVTNMARMFYAYYSNSSSFNQDISNWDVSNVTDMSEMFLNASSFNQPIGDWDVSNVTDMRAMFANTPFNQPIGNWDVSNVTDMGAMFRAESFNQPIGDWDVSNVTNMRAMFYGAKSFNQPIGNWDVSNVTDMGFMFYIATVFNQPIGDWDVSNVTIMNYMFGNATVFNQPIGGWNVSNVTTMEYMFGRNGNEGNNLFNQDISNWDVSNVTDMSVMFKYNEAFNQNLSSWSVDGVNICGGFSDNTPSWTLPQPNFTNCTP